MSDGLMTASLHMAAWLPALVLFCHVPLALYRPNQDEFNRQAEVLLPFGLALVPAIAIISAVLAVFPVQATTIGVLLFALGMYLLFSDMFVPVRLGNVILGVTRDNVRQPASDSVVQLVLFAACMGCGLWLPLAEYLPWLAIPSALLLLFGARSVLTFDERNRRSFRRFVTGNKSSANTDDARPGEASGGKGNVYHIVLDGYPGRLFSDYLEKHAQNPAFEGFSCFRNTLANYLFTYPSVASYMTGSFHPQKDVRSWREAWQKDGLMGAYAEDGYTVWQYATQKMHWQHENADYFHPAVDDACRAKERMLTFADMWLLRVVPVCMKKMAFASGSGNTGRLFRLFMPAWCSEGYLYSDAKANLDMIYSFINDEEKRPAAGQYVYMHAYMPHQPYITDSDCTLKSGATMQTQCDCVLRLVADFVGELKKQGKFDSATIIVQSDHGWIMDTPEHERFFSFPAEVFETLENENPDMLPAWQIPDFAHALLMVKRPGDAGAMRIVPQPVQLADLPRTLEAITGVRLGTQVGTDIFGEEAAEERDLPVFAGYSCKKGILGMSEFEARILRLEYNTKSGWRVGETTNITWD